MKNIFTLVTVFKSLFRLFENLAGSHAYSASCAGFTRDAAGVTAIVVAFSGHVVVALPVATKLR